MIRTPWFIALSWQGFPFECRFRVQKWLQHHLYFEGTVKEMPPFFFVQITKISRSHGCGYVLKSIKKGDGVMYFGHFRVQKSVLIQKGVFSNHNQDVQQLYSYKNRTVRRATAQKNTREFKTLWDFLHSETIQWVSSINLFLYAVSSFDFEIKPTYFWSLVTGKFHAPDLLNFSMTISIESLWKMISGADFM